MFVQCCGGTSSWMQRVPESSHGTIPWDTELEWYSHEGTDMRERTCRELGQMGYTTGAAELGSDARASKVNVVILGGEGVFKEAEL